jgi:hypothetical protein
MSRSEFVVTCLLLQLTFRNQLSLSLTEFETFQTAVSQAAANVRVNLPSICRDDRSMLLHRLRIE